MGRLGIFVTLFLIVELYTYFGLRPIFESSESRKIFSLIYLLQSAVVLYALYKMYFGLVAGEVFRSTELNLMIGIVFTSFVTKLIFSGVILVQDLLRLVGYIGTLFSTVFTESTISDISYPGRRKFISQLAAGISAIPLFSMLYGITRGKYRFQVNKVSLAFKDLPPAFDGFKIVQISDIHAGSIDSRKDVMRGVSMVNDLDPDIICFTGDLVNTDKDEIDPLMDIFTELKAKKGKYAVLGNHDYYGVPRNDSSVVDAYWSSFYKKFETMGFDLLNNETRTIEVNGDQLALVGVENWGAGRWFPKKGDLDKALIGVSDDAFTILMSHDPTHWEEKVKPNPKHIHLTLSGHTHGMQFGFQMPGFKWSPAQYRYPLWSGLYEGNGQYLYVNKGFGFLAFPGRVGMWPEITSIELKSI